MEPLTFPRKKTDLGGIIKPILNHQGIWVLEGDTHISKWVNETGRLDHDQWMLPIIQSLINQGDHVIDGGCYIGDHTIAYTRWAKKVVGIDPNSEAIQCCRLNVLGAKIIHGFLGESSDISGSLRIEEGNFGASKILLGGDLRCYTIDEIVQNELDGRVDFIKLDIEGGELSALRGAKDTLAKLKPKLLLEINRWALSLNGVTPENILDLLRNYGYRWRIIQDGQTIDSPQFDIICE